MLGSPYGESALAGSANVLQLSRREETLGSSVDLFVSPPDRPQRIVATVPDRSTNSRPMIAELQTSAAGTLARVFVDRDPLLVIEQMSGRVEQVEITLPTKSGVAFDAWPVTITHFADPSELEWADALAALSYVNQAASRR